MMSKQRTIRNMLCAHCPCPLNMSARLFAGLKSAPDHASSGEIKSNANRSTQILLVSSDSPVACAKGSAA